MKKAFKISVTVFISLFTFSTLSCIDFSTSSPRVGAPEINYAAEGLQIVPKAMTTCSYMNIFRVQESGGKYDFDTAIDVGQIIPINKFKGPFTFEDKSALASTNYKYYIRYKSSTSGYAYSTASKPKAPKVSQGGTQYSVVYKDALDQTYDEITLTYDGTTSANFSVDDAYVLSSGGTTDSAYSYIGSHQGRELMLGIKNGSLVKLFPLARDAPNHFYINFAAVLPEAYLDTDISLECLVMQDEYKRYDDDEDEESVLRYTTANWTKSCKIKLVDKTDKPIPGNVIRVPKTVYINDYDYTESSYGDSE